MTQSDQDQDDKKLLVSLQENGLEKFLLYGHRQICRLLQEMVSSRALISVHLFPCGLSFLSNIITLSENEDWVFLDTSSNETIFRRSLEAERLICVTQLDKICVQFRLSNVTEIPLEGRPALAAPVPKEILRLQRRDAFRLQVPFSHNLKCILPAQEHEHGQKGRKKSIEASVINISVGGLSLEIPFGKTVPAVGDQINGCYLKLSDKLVSVDLEVRNQGRHLLANGKEILRLGCSFVSLPTQTANQIQRYIYHIERELRAFDT